MEIRDLLKKAFDAGQEYGSDKTDKNFNDFADKHKEQLRIANVSTRFLILSGEGGHQTDHQFVMELNTLEEANEQFDELKKGEFDGTYLFIYEAKKLREE